MAELFWLFASAGSAAILGTAIAYVLLTRRPLTGREQKAQGSRIDWLYRGPNGKNGK